LSFPCPPTASPAAQQGRQGKPADCLWQGSSVRDDTADASCSWHAAAGAERRQSLSGPAQDCARLPAGRAAGLRDLPWAGAANARALEAVRSPSMRWMAPACTAPKAAAPCRRPTPLAVSRPALLRCRHISLAPCCRALWQRSGTLLGGQHHAAAELPCSRHHIAPCMPRPGLWRRAPRSRRQDGCQLAMAATAALKPHPRARAHAALFAQAHPRIGRQLQS